MPNQVPLPVQAAIKRAAEKINRHLAIKQALEYIACRRGGGSMLECLGHFRLIPPDPGDPYFEELLNNIEVDEKRRLLMAVKEQWLEEIDIIERRLEELELQVKTRKTA